MRDRNWSISGPNAWQICDDDDKRTHCLSITHVNQLMQFKQQTSLFVWRITPHTSYTVCTRRRVPYSCLFCLPLQPTVGLYYHSPVASFSLLVSRGFLITHNDAPQSVGLQWTSDQPVAETSTWQHTTLTTDKHLCPWWDSNPRSQQASGRRPTP